MNVPSLLLVLGVYGLAIWATHGIAKAKNRDVAAWTLLAVVLPGLALLAALVVSSVPSAAPQRLGPRTPSTPDVSDRPETASNPEAAMHVPAPRPPSESSRPPAPTQDASWPRSQSETDSVEQMMAQEIAVPRVFGGICGLAFRSDSRSLVVTMSTGLWLFDCVESKPIGTLTTGSEENGSCGMAIDEHRRLLATPSVKGDISLWDLSRGALVRRLDSGQGGFALLALSSSANLLASGGSDGSVRVWQLPSCWEVRTLRAGTFCVNSIAFDPTGTLLAVGDVRGIKLWSIPSWEEYARLTIESSGVHAPLLFSPDGRTLYCGYWDGRVGEWDVAGRQERYRFPAGNFGPVSLAISPDGRKLVACGEGTVRIWNTQTRELLQSATSDAGWPAFRPDGALIAMAGARWDRAINCPARYLLLWPIGGPGIESYDGTRLQHSGAGDSWTPEKTGLANSEPNS